ncbi:DUF6197 family protein [Kitasatospora camelliae]|uniref:Uncharacterized protein n=1 Tax=Kitasatospora camelliae TaxID=3156397 RepID=A0AAU8JX53_9ACTN
MPTPSPTLHRPAPHPPLLTLDGSGLVEEIERYLASLPPSARPAIPYVCPLGSTLQPWNAGYPPPRRTPLDRLLRRPARPVEVTVAGHLRLTSRYLAAAGWLQGAMWDAGGRVCLLGAQAAVLAHGYGTPYTVRRARTQVMEVLHATGRPVPSPDSYNDAPGTTQADVHRLLDQAAARAGVLGI